MVFSSENSNITFLYYAWYNNNTIYRRYSMSLFRRKSQEAEGQKKEAEGQKKELKASKKDAKALRQDYAALLKHRTEMQEYLTDEPEAAASALKLIMKHMMRLALAERRQQFDRDFQNFSKGFGLLKKMPPDLAEAQRSLQDFSLEGNPFGHIKQWMDKTLPQVTNVSAFGNHQQAATILAGMSALMNKVSTLHLASATDVLFYTNKIATAQHEFVKRFKGERNPNMSVGSLPDEKYQRNLSDQTLAKGKELFKKLVTPPAPSSGPEPK